MNLAVTVGAASVEDEAGFRGLRLRGVKDLDMALLTQTGLRHLE
jgi:hypothetical protein